MKEYGFGVDEFLTQIVTNQSNDNQTIDFIFDTVDEWLLKGKFAWVDLSLKSIDQYIMTINTLLSFLTITGAARSKLPSRADYFMRVRERFIKAKGCRYADEILRGLE